MSIRKLASYRVVITRVTLLYYLVALLWRWYSHLLPSQLMQPALSRVHLDLSFWMFKLTGLDKLIVDNTIGALVFSFSVIALCVLVMLFPGRKAIAVLFSCCFLALAIAFNVYLCHSAHYLGGMIWITLAFWPQKDENFELIWEGMRYYACWIYGSAFAWKVVNGAFFQWDAGTLSFKSNLVEYLYHNPEGAMAEFYRFFLAHPLIVNIGHKVIMLAEGALIIGFFTKRYDKLLIFCTILIFASTYIFSDVFFAELLVIIFPLLPVSVWSAITTMLPWFNRRIGTSDVISRKR